MSKRAIPVVLVVLVVGGLLAATYFLVAELEIEARKGAGAGWSEAEGEIQGSIRSALREGFVDIDLGPDVLDRIAVCVTGRIIDFLNGTDCDDYYDQSTTSEAEHLAAQEACLKGVGYDAREVEFTMACSKEHVPDDWNIMRPLLSREMDAALQGHALEPAQRKAAVDCVVAKTVEILGKTGCAPLNQEARTPDQLFTPADACFERSGLKAEAEAAIGACLVAAP